MLQVSSSPGEYFNIHANAMTNWPRLRNPVPPPSAEERERKREAVSMAIKENLVEVNLDSSFAKATKPLPLAAADTTPYEDRILNTDTIGDCLGQSGGQLNWDMWSYFIEGNTNSNYPGLLERLAQLGFILTEEAIERLEEKVEVEFATLPVGGRAGASGGFVSYVLAEIGVAERTPDRGINMVRERLGRAGIRISPPRVKNLASVRHMIDGGRGLDRGIREIRARLPARVQQFVRRISGTSINFAGVRSAFWDRRQRREEARRGLRQGDLNRKYAFLRNPLAPERRNVAHIRRQLRNLIR